jgi:hypothetical protein
MSIKRMKRAGPVAAGLVAALLLVPAASSGTYSDPAGDSGAAGDLTGVTVMGDKNGGQVVFRISGTNLASSLTNVLILRIDSDANPLTGNLAANGADYSFIIDGEGYWFDRWDGSHWVATSYATVQITGNTSGLMISVNRSELGNTSAFNFEAATLAFGSTSGFDAAPNDGAFNYSYEYNGPDILSVDVQTAPSAGPKAGKKFVVTSTGLKLPPSGATSTTPLLPESYTCTAKLGARTLIGTATGKCTFSIPKKKARGKRLTVVLTVSYQGVTKSVPLTFKVA